MLSGVVAALLTVVLYLPALVRMGLARVAANPYVAARPPGEVVRGLTRTLGLAWLQWNSDVPRAVAAVFVLAWAASLVRLLVWRRGCAGPTRLLLTVLGFSVSAALVQRVVPYDRVWLFALPLYLACVAEGLSGVIERLPLPAPLRPGLALLLCDRARALRRARRVARSPVRGGPCTTATRSPRCSNRSSAPTMASWR